MIRPYLPLNGLRAFEAAARHLSFTKAAIEMCVTPAALSHQVKGLEERLGIALFHRRSRGLALTDEAQALLPVLRDAFDRIADLLSSLQGSDGREVISVGAVGTFAVKWLLPRLAHFRAQHPSVDLRLTTNNNRVDMAEEGLDLAIRFGDGAWHGTDAVLLFEAPLTPLCTPALAEGIRSPDDLREQILLRSYRASEWPEWFHAAGSVAPSPLTGPVFDSGALMVEAALAGEGVALAPARLFRRDIEEDRAVTPFRVAIDAGGYWLTRLKGRKRTPAMSAFENWLVEETAADP